MTDTESLLRIAGRLNDIDARVRSLETYGHRIQSIAPYWSVAAARAIWPMGPVDYQQSYCLDVAGGDHHLDDINGATFGNDDAAPYVEFNGTTQYLRKVDGGAGNWADITGTETVVAAAQRGLTIGGWFNFDRLTNAEHLIGKTDGVVANASYWLLFRGDLAGDPFTFNISDGAAVTTVSLTLSTAPSAGAWTFVMGRYDPSTELKVYTGQGDGAPLETNTNVAAIPAALNDGTADFTIGSTSGGGNYLAGKASYCVLCASMLSDAMITAIYSQTRALFGV